MATLRDLKSGEVFEGYTLLQHTASGGQADVWAAWEPAEERVIALKIQSPVFSDNSEPSTTDEISIASRLSHPQIVPIISSHRETEYPYIAMEYFAMGSLADLIKKGPIRPAEIMRIAYCLVSALEYTHGERVIHRDLKPTNILIDSRHRAYLMDFGIAKVLSQSTVTLHTGHGTAHYAAPEQHTLMAITPQSDIYSLGIILYEMATGILPWNGDASLALKQISDGEEMPDPREVNPDLPENLVDILRWFTAFRPEDRPANVHEVWEGMLQVFPRALPANAVIIRSGTDQMLSEDATALLKRESTRWFNSSGVFETGLADFAVIHSFFARNHKDVLPTPLRAYMLAGALAHGFFPEAWWAGLEQQKRLDVCQRILLFEGQDAVARTLRLMRAEPRLIPEGERLPEVTIGALTSLIGTPQGGHALVLLERMLPQAGSWSEVSLGPLADIQLAEGAISTDRTHVLATHLIGKVKSESAVRAIARDINPNLAAARIMDVWTTSHTLPRSLNPMMRLRVWGALMRQMFTSGRSKVLTLFLVASAACGMALGINVFTGYRLTTIVDSTRILNAVGSALLFGPVIGLGVFMARLVTSRLMPLRKGARISAGILAGTLFITLGFTGFHKLFLNTTPQWLIITFASLIMSSGYSISEAVVRHPIARSLIMGVVVALTIALSWGAYVSGQYTPLLYFEVGRPVQTGVQIMVSALCMGGAAYLKAAYEMTSSRGSPDQREK